MNVVHVRILDILGDRELPGRDVRNALNEHTRKDERYKPEAFSLIINEMVTAGLIEQRDDVLPSTSVPCKCYKKAGVGSGGYNLTEIPCLWTVRQKRNDMAVAVGRMLRPHQQHVIVVALTPEDALAKYNLMTFGTEEAPIQSDYLRVEVDAVSPVVAVI